jgi:pimeloyl-ACP methyl ester carboxylesterase
MHPDDLRYEAKEPAQVRPGQLYEVAYQELIEELRFNLREREDQAVPVHPFAYDWRQPLKATEQQLAGFIEEVIARTKLLKHYDAAGYDAKGKPGQVNLVGHSMGGLVIAGYLDQFGGAHKVAKVATLATPYQGSFEAVIKVTTGTANLGTSAPSSREREAARLTPALYHLLPSFKSGIEIAAGLPGSLFDIGLWQPGVIETIEEYIRLHGLRPKQRAKLAPKLFGEMLTEAKNHRERTMALDLAACGLVTKDWLCVVGVDSVTRVKLGVEEKNGEANFAFHSSDRDNQWSESKGKKKRRLTGDGTVPFEGALPGFLPYEELVCVSPNDYGYWEVEDKAMTKVAGFHGILPNMNMLHRLIVRHFTGRPDKHGNTWGRSAPGVEVWKPPVDGLKDRKAG